MKTIYSLTPEEVEEVTFSARFISDRQEQLPGKYDRWDMFWIQPSLNGQDLGALCVEPLRNSPDEFYLSRNHCKVAVGYNRLCTRAYDWFLTTKEYQNQRRWMKQLIEKQ